MSRRLLLLLIFFLPSTALADYQRFEENGKMGIKDTQGKVILPAAFDALGWSDGNFSVIGEITGYRKAGSWGLLNLKKEFITEATYLTLTYSGGDRVVASRAINPFTTKFGCLGLDGKIAIPFQYDDIELQGMHAIVMIKSGVRYEYGLVDLNNSTVLPIRYKKITPLGSLRYSVKDFSDKIAVCTETGTWTTAFVLDSISNFLFDHAILYEDWKQGILHRNGKVIATPQYRDIKITAPGKILARRADEWKMTGPDRVDLHRLDADELVADPSGWNRFTIQGKSGFVDGSFQIKWPAFYDFIGPMQNGMTVVKTKGKFGVLRKDQSVVLPLEFDSLILEGNYVRGLRKNEKFPWHLYDTMGIMKSSGGYEFIGAFNGLFFTAKKHGYYGGLDRFGKEKLACVYDSILEVKDDLCIVRWKGQYGVITIEDKWCRMPQRNPVSFLDSSHLLEKQDSMTLLKDFEGNLLYFTDHPLTIMTDRLREHLPDGTEKEINFKGQIINRKEPNASSHEVVALQGNSFRESEGLTGIKRDGKFGFVDARGRLRIANRYEDIGEFKMGLAPVKLLGKWGYIDAEDQIVIQPTFEATENFDFPLAIVSRAGKNGLIDKTGRIVLDIKYDVIQRLPDQLYTLTLDNLHGLASSEGRVLIEPRFTHIQPLSNGLAIVSRDDRYGVLTIEGLSVFPMEFNELKYLPSRNVFFTRKVSPWVTIPVEN